MNKKNTNQKGFAQFRKQCKTQEIQLRNLIIGKLIFFLNVTEHMDTSSIKIIPAITTSYDLNSQDV